MDKALGNFALLTEIQKLARHNPTGCSLWFDLEPNQINHILSLSTTAIMKLANHKEVCLEANISPESMESLVAEIKNTGRADHTILRYIDGRIG